MNSCMVRCQNCREQGNEEEYSDPYETGLRSRKGGYPLMTGFVLPTSTSCNSCGDKAQVSGWFEKDPHI